MADGHRVYPVDYVVLHHSVGPEFGNSSDLEVQDWFDQIGRNRGYAGVAHSYHSHPQRNKETFAQAHLALRAYTQDGNKYGWRLTPLMQDIWNNVAWHAGNWPINQRSIGIETCGNYSDHPLPEKALMLVADYFRAHDKSIGSKLQITAHKQFSATACPGQIFNQREIIIDMINNADKWNQKLWPSDPVPTGDSLYRIMKDDVQIGAFREKKNAMDVWYTDKTQKVMLNGKDITSDFIAMVTELEKQIEELKKAYDTVKEANKRLISDVNTLNQELDACRRKLKTAEVTQEDLQRKLDNILSSVWGKVYLFFKTNG